MSRRFGLALSGGGARGFAHIGVLRALHQRLRPDFISATSMGAVIAALYAARLDVDWVELVARDFASRGLRIFWDWKLPKSGLSSGRHLEEFLRRHLGDAKFSDLKLPIAVTATDIHKGAPVVLRDGDLVSALCASFAVPGLLAPVARRVAGEELLLVDGGVSNPLPADLARQAGCGVMLAVSANPSYAHPSTDPRQLPATELTIRSFYIMQKFIATQHLQPQDTLIELNLKDCPFLDFGRLDFLVEQGRLQTSEVISTLEARMRAEPAPRPAFWKRIRDLLRFRRG